MGVGKGVGEATKSSSRKFFLHDVCFFYRGREMFFDNMKDDIAGTYGVPPTPHKDNSERVGDRPDQPMSYTDYINYVLRPSKWCLSYRL